MTELTIFAVLGFLLASYSVVGNDALQTLGTFINSNSRLHWFWLFLFAATILIVTFGVGWVVNDQDPSWGRLANAEKYPEVTIEWYHTLPPLVLLVITRLGVPVSTTFMALTVFATVGGLTSMLQKSLTGYGLAFIVGLLVYLAVVKTLEKHFRTTNLEDDAPFGVASSMGILVALFIYFVPPLLTGGTVHYSGIAATVIAVLGIVVEAGLYFATKKFGKIVYWSTLQWITTAYLWSVWLIQDFANIFVFLPRELELSHGILAMLAITGLLAYTFWNQGGPVQRILKSKTAVTDIRSAALLNFVYASLLFLFKEVSEIPMSTTFVFLGLIAGREIGFSIVEKKLRPIKAIRVSVSDASKAFTGLIISINMAIGLPFLAQYLTKPQVSFADAFPSPSFLVFVIAANALIVPIGIFLAKQKSNKRMILALICLLSATLCFWIIPPEVS